MDDDGNENCNDGGGDDDEDGIDADDGDYGDVEKYYDD